MEIGCHVESTPNSTLMSSFSHETYIRTPIEVMVNESTTKDQRVVRRTSRILLISVDVQGNLRKIKVKT